MNREQTGQKFTLKVEATYKPIVKIYHLKFICHKAAYKAFEELQNQEPRFGGGEYCPVITELQWVPE